MVYYAVYYDLWLGNWNDYCLEIVEDITLPEEFNSLEVWYKLDDNEISQLENPNDVGHSWSWHSVVLFPPNFDCFTYIHVF